MAPITVSVPHALGRVEAKQRLTAGLERVPKMEMVALERQEWTDDRMTFVVRAFGASLPGLLEVRDDNVQVQIELPGLLRKLATPVGTALRERARLLLQKR